MVPALVIVNGEGNLEWIVKDKMNIGCSPKINPFLLSFPSGKKGL